MEERANTITWPLDAKEEKALRRVESERLLPGDAWDWYGNSRRTIVIYPQADDHCRAAYSEALADVRGHVAAMRAALSVRLGERVYKQTERREGRLHRRRLALASVTDRVFHQRLTRSAPGLSLALLLDASGSMKHGNPPKYAAALRVALLAAEALKNVPGVELEIYAHRSGGNAHRDCLFQYLYGKRNPLPVTLGGYDACGVNYDHQAILTATDLLVANTKNPRRMLIVVGDGAPNGKGYSGEPAVRATREAVEAVRRRGIRVINVAIEDYASEAIFGSAHVLKFTDIGRLVADMRVLLTRLLRS
jgi:nitric oxide reductase activation protein